MNNLTKRIVFGTLFMAIMVGCLLACRYTFALLACVITVGMMNEFYKMTMGSRYKYSRILAMVAGLITFIVAFCSKSFPEFPSELFIIVMLPLFIVMINSLYVKDKSDFGKFANVYTGILYVTLPVTFMNFLVFDAQGNYSGILLLCFFAIIWASDVGGYAFGVTIGQKWGKKLFPEVSPKKSWAGFWGGLFFAMLTSMAFYWTGLFDFPWWHCLGLAVIMNVFGVYGDLFESQWKRCYCIKDSGNAIPGHGGFLDRFDSSLFAIPVGVIYMTIFNLL